MALLLPVSVGQAQDEQCPPLEQATFAGGCFWCMEAPFAARDGVVRVTSGYTGGREVDPSYEEVASGHTGHLEAVQILFDPNRISYPQLLEIFWRQIDPTDDGGQFVDRGPSYRAAIFYHSEDQRRQAQQSLDQLQNSGRFAAPIVTAIEAAGPFYAAESYHQNFHVTSPQRYQRYRTGSGRDAFLRQAWRDEVGRPSWENFIKPDDVALQQQLDPLVYRVTQHNGTEAPFSHPYAELKEDGLYVDVVSGEPLFSSRDKFDSGTGWPSFTRPLTPTALVEKADRSLFVSRTEVRSRLADSHLGHVFGDGPPPTGRRYCINGAALRFVPRADLARAGYGQWAQEFERP
ncbi:MAG: peptide-methionine (S)-S-oxide reductase MsrA [Desulfuromonadaceae bacterium]|nr:peptide-methionine (S)-S-oxide reductase MsrA [Desulfuromonadaceae bacterium]